MTGTYVQFQALLPVIMAHQNQSSHQYVVNTTLAVGFGEGGWPPHDPGSGFSPGYPGEGPPSGGIPPYDPGSGFSPGYPGKGPPSGGEPPYDPGSGSSPGNPGPGIPPDSPKPGPIIINEPITLVIGYAETGGTW